MAAARRRRTSGEAVGPTAGAVAQQAPVAPEVTAEVDRVLGQLSSKDWRDRSNALRDVDAMLVRLQGFPDGLLISVMEGLAPRLSDGNAKVLVQALEVRRGCGGSVVGYVARCSKEKQLSTPSRFVHASFNTSVPAQWLSRMTSDASSLLAAFVHSW